MTTRTLVRLAVLSLIWGGCEGGINPAQTSEPGSGISSQYSPCTEEAKCCTADLMRCTGDPDTGGSCVCEGLWECSQNPQKCDQAAPVPTDTSNWSCTWTTSEYRCTAAGRVGTPSGAASWRCGYDATNASTVCKRAFPPNPTNRGQGVGSWTCEVQGDELSCEQGSTDTSGTESGNNDETSSGTGSNSESDSGSNGNDQGSSWPFNPFDETGSGTSGGNGGNGGIGDNGGIDFGDNGGNGGFDFGDNGDNGGLGGFDLGGNGGLGGFDLGFKAPSTCTLGQQAWCDGPTYCGWGIVKCGPDGTWEKNAYGQIKCVEQSERRPDTQCARYTAFYNPDCCEQANCVLPDGTSGQTTSRSQGKLCDYCNPQNPECTGVGARCVQSGLETFCSQQCSQADPCPSGYNCTKGYCVPSSGSCLK